MNSVWVQGEMPRPRSRAGVALDDGEEVWDRLREM